MRRYGPSPTQRVQWSTKSWGGSVDDQDALTGSSKRNKSRTGTAWKADWRVIGGVRKYYRSRWEANYARYLEWLKEHGQIASWEHEAETFWFLKIMRGVRSYLPDFKVTNKDGTVEYHEVKGRMCARSKTTLKRMKKYHPNVNMVVIDGKAYGQLAKYVGGLIEGWE